MSEKLFEPINDASEISRRNLLVGVVTTGVLASAGSALGTSGKFKARKELSSKTSLPSPRTMASSVMLPNGLLMIIGGYNRPPERRGGGIALDTVCFVDPRSGQWVSAAPLNAARARHAAVALPDGRVVVTGGIGLKPLSTVEVFDPRSETWGFDTALAFPRFDHSAVWDGSRVLVVGGTSATAVTTIEILHPLVGISNSRQL